jgi:hypothetical protein
VASIYTDSSIAGMGEASDSVRISLPQRMGCDHLTKD